MACKARLVLQQAEALNRELGHENLGPLSLTHGFLPTRHPTVKLPSAFNAWNKLAASLPKLLSAGRLRSYCDTVLPLLDAVGLPDSCVVPALLLLGSASHAYWHLGGTTTPQELPPALEVPWRYLCKERMGRGDTPFLGCHELLVSNFRLPKCKGGEDYRVADVVVEKFDTLISVTGVKEEHVFYGVITEAMSQSAPLFESCLGAQEAVLNNDIGRLKKCLGELRDGVLDLSFQTFTKIDQQALAPHFVSPAVFAKTVAPVAVPIFEGEKGPSGTSVPVFHMLDAIFSRRSYDGFIGNEVMQLVATFPPHWQEFIAALTKVDVAKFVADSKDMELKGIFCGALQAYAGEHGFLGRHRLKMLGYLECIFKMGRNITLGGFAGLVSERTWERIGVEMEKGRRQRLQLPVDARSALCQVRMIRIDPNLQAPTLPLWQYSCPLAARF